MVSSTERILIGVSIYILCPKSRQSAREEKQWKRFWRDCVVFDIYLNIFILYVCFIS